MRRIQSVTMGSIALVLKDSISSSQKKVILTSSNACEWLETSVFKWPKVDCEFPSSLPAISSRALMPEPYVVFNFPNLPRS